MMYPHGPCTLKQKQLLRELCPKVDRPIPDFDSINREEAHRMISNILHEIKLNQSGKDVGYRMNT